jgi:hypothetical protein
MRAVYEASTLRRKSLILTLLAALSGLGPGLSQTPVPNAEESSKPPTPWPVDRILAVVDDDPILSSDVRQVIALGIVAAKPGEENRALWRRVLDMQIEQRLRMHDLDRFGFTDVAPQAIDKAFEAVRARFPTPEEFAERLRQVGLTEDGLKQLVARQLMVFGYVEERLGARVFVSLDDISAYYHDVLAAEMLRERKPLPPLDDVRESIRTVLREQRLLEEIERWTSELRQQADVVDSFDSVHTELPPVVFRDPPR